MKIKVCQWIGLCLVLLFSACSKKSSYVNVLPADASCVVSAHLPALVEKSGLSDKEIEMFMSQVDHLTKEKAQSPDWTLLGKLLASPDQIGVDWNKEVYFFMHPSIHYGGLLASVEDRGKLESVIKSFVEEGLCKPLADREGFRLTLVDDRLALAFNEDALLLVDIPFEMEAENTSDLLAGWMNASEEQSFVSTKSFKKLSDAEGDVKLVASANMLPQEYAAMAMTGVAEDILWKDLHSVVSVSFEKGEMLLRAENFYTDKKAEKAFLKIADYYEGETSGKFLSKFSNDRMFWLNTTINGRKWYEALCQQPLVEEQLKNTRLPLDVEKCITALKGELALGVSVSSRIPDIGLYAEVDNEDLLQELAPLQTTLRFLGFQYGIEDGVFSLTNHTVGKDASLKDAAWAKDSKDKLFFMTLDLEALKALTPFLSASEGVTLRLLTTYIDNIQIYSSEVHSGCLALKAVDKDTNFLKQCVDLVKKMAVTQ